jgi:hypothetical protein
MNLAAITKHPQTKVAAEKLATSHSEGAVCPRNLFFLEFGEEKQIPRFARVDKKALFPLSVTSVLLNPMNPYWIVVGFSSLLQMFFFLRWLHRRTRDDEIRSAFVRDMAINHLPHLYHALSQIAGHLGIQLKEPPHVQFLELNGPERKR